ncbi:neurogenic locus notch homolog protein 3 isoform X1 [Diabrotica virgifera virgifera]|uniref:Neurogenic locus notch homolog protein 3 isoform X1 n=2 Tax=Diabrotica virgifera virgifera TaxID=50390 RepID=A0A6P7GLI3_DIAVI|nr:neurogenic locus notch homolog protein 3 isoform X1 [Diabrotica virgifera virgifera]
MRNLLNFFSVLLVLHCYSVVLGEPSYYRQYRVLGDYPYQTYYGNPYADHPYRYASNSDVYITDRYGRTSLRSGDSYRVSSYSSTTCTSGTCGQNAQCQVVGGRPVCSCLRGHSGDPLSLCRREECLDDGECRGQLACRGGKCIDPCVGTCGVNANCEARRGVPVCTCPAGYTGDPITSCRRFNPEELCHPSPCGPNTHCEVKNEVPTCSCLPGFHGSPLAGCRHECESDVECGPTLACIEFKCQNPCLSQCGKNAECETISNHRAVCKCPKNYFGNPYSSCQPECYGDVDCPSSKPACYYGICKSPCEGACGVGANCELRGLTPVCSCPKDMTGDPFIRCRPFEPRDLCEPNPCGSNAHCEPGFDRSNNERPVCTCPRGFTGDPLRACFQGECTEDSQCPDSQACIDYKCQNPCINQCGVNANCNARRHLAVCTCPTGYHGDALIHCYPRTSEAAGRSYF